MLSVMYLNDDYKTAKIGDRIIARAIAGFCGFWLGGFFGILVYEFTDNNYGLAWFFALAFGVFAFFSLLLSSFTSSWHFTALTWCPDLVDHFIMMNFRPALFLHQSFVTGLKRIV